MLQKVMSIIPKPGDTVMTEYITRNGMYCEEVQKTVEMVITHESGAVLIIYYGSSREKTKKIIKTWMRDRCYGES